MYYQHKLNVYLFSDQTLYTTTSTVNFELYLVKQKVEISVGVGLHALSLYAIIFSISIKTIGTVIFYWSEIIDYG